MSRKCMRSDRHDDYYNYTLRNARSRKGYTLLQLSKLSGVLRSSIAHYERLYSFPVRDHAQLIAKALEVTVEELFPERLQSLTKEVQEERLLSKIQNRKNPKHTNIYDVPEEQLPTVPDSIEEVMQRENPDNVRIVLESLTYREQEILRMKYGIGSKYAKTHEEIAKEFQILRERVRQIEQKALEKLRHPHRRRLLEGFED